jgi:hypothetical protein
MQATGYSQIEKLHAAALMLDLVAGPAAKAHEAA